MTGSKENHDQPQSDERQMQRLNTLASLTGMITVFLFVFVLISVYFFPSLFAPPPATPLPTRTPTLTPTTTLTPTPTITPTIPPPTSTPAPVVEILSVEYLQAGVGCQVAITVKVNGDPLTGAFHLWNASNTDPAGTISPAETLPSGLTNNHLVTLGGGQPQFYLHEIWFEYEGGQSNRLTGLVCPGLTPEP